MNLRIGIGFDVHRTQPQRPLVLGGVTIPSDFGLVGHSDADVLLHAIIDAMLGAAGLGDIGEHFPDNDPAWKDADSRELMRAARSAVEAAGYVVGNVDAVVVAEAPRLGPHKESIREALAGLLGLPISAVGVKAKTCEGTDAVGRKEAISCYATVLLRGE